jgi:hypothetical protein
MYARLSNSVGVLLEMSLLQLSLDSKDEIAKEGNVSQHFVIHVFSIGVFKLLQILYIGSTAN